MTSSGNERRHSNHSVTDKVITCCYICEKSVKDYRLSSHLLFGSLQCKNCDFKFRYCKDFDSFRKCKDERSNSCVHQALRWTRDPVEYLERKLRKELSKSESGEHQPSTREVTKGMISYVGKLKPIECKSPWRYAIEKLRKYVSLKHEGRKYSRSSQHHEKDKHARKDKVSRREKRRGSKSKEKEENLYYKEETTEKISHENAIKETNCETTNLTEEVDMCLNDTQDKNELLSEEGMIPQCVEEIVIPQTEWEIDIGSFNEFEECNKSVAISLKNGIDDSIPFILEEVCITKHEDAGVVTLIIEDLESTSETKLNMPGCQDSKEVSADVSENKIKPVGEVCKNKIEAEELYADKTKPEEVIGKENAEPREEIYVNEPREEIDEDQAKLEKDSYDNDTSCSEEIPINKLETLAAVCESERETLAAACETERETSEACERKIETSAAVGKNERKLESESAFDKETFVEKEESTSYKNDTEVQSSLSGDEDRSEFKGRRKASTTRKSRTNKESSKCKFVKRRCYRMRNALRRNIQENNLHTQEDNWKPQRHQRNSHGNIFKTSKYNLRSRRKQLLSNSFLQKLDAYEKKKLWEKLVPTARKLRRLRAKGDKESSSTLYLPIDSDEYDDDFLVDVLLSQTLDIQQLKEISYLSSDENDDETIFLLNQVKKAIKQFSFSVDRPCFTATVKSPKSLANRCVKNDSMKTRRDLVATEINAKNDKDVRHLDRMVFGKDTPKKQSKTFYVVPPPDGKYYVVTYPSQPFITECPMCYFRVFPAMFSLNLVTNLATTKCVGCMLTIYVVQEPDDNNSFPKIVFRREPSEDDPKVPKPARYKLSSPKLHKKVSPRRFFK